MNERSFAKISMGLALLLVSLTLGACSASRGTVSDARTFSGSSRECLARAMYFESNRSSEDGMLAVGSVVMNRVESRQFQNSICGVVGAPRQFAQGVLSKPMKEGASRERALKVADAILSGKRHKGVDKKVMYFHTAGLKFPYNNMHYTVVAGGNAFYEKRSRKPTIPVAPIETASPVIMVADARPATRNVPSFATASADQPERSTEARTVVASYAPAQDAAPAPAVARAQPETQPAAAVVQAVVEQEPARTPVLRTATQPKPVYQPKPVVVASMMPLPPSRSTMAAPPARAPRNLTELIEATSHVNAGLGPIY
ncbi:MULTISPECIES: cell wall hydrolase [unclassified Chelatococcus]|uniref:cell wall hydrolase n=1 Tax=unclassified Chelatococcus TaxID=2638111 RepID=UPI001BCEE67A|nr:MULTISPECIES: cell wall hydrolase [unclassified Chelatococcus]MBS7696648.1 cell wall hydrolase [Chelatococcus sp. YT9]MBX3555213.1 cell wall hydrolase [Chelatococcus sp.]